MPIETPTLVPAKADDRVVHASAAAKANRFMGWSAPGWSQPYRTTLEQRWKDCPKTGPLTRAYTMLVPPSARRRVHVCGTGISIHVARATATSAPEAVKMAVPARRL